MKVRRKTEIVEARLYTGENAQEMAEFMGKKKPHMVENNLLVRGCDGALKEAFPGDWIIQKSAHEFFPISPYTFDTLYEHPISHYTFDTLYEQIKEAKS